MLNQKEPLSGYYWEAEAMVHESGILYYLFLSWMALDQEVCIQWPLGIKVLVLMSIL